MVSPPRNFRVFAAIRPHLSPVDLSPYRSFLAQLARESGDFIRPHFGNLALAVESKSDASPVTLADRGAEQLLRHRIAEKFPTHGIIGEEFGSENANAEFVWVLDPIDGTKSFITGVPLFATLIALLHQGQPILGAIHQPILGQLVLGDNATATLNDRPIRCRTTTHLEDATLLTSDPLNIAKYQPASASRYDALAQRAKLYRTWGDAYGYLLVATGWADIMLDPIMNPWDIAALVPIIRGSGGIITDWHGAAPYPAESTLACATPALHAAVLASL